MSSIKLRDIGQAMGFIIPKKDLKKAQFEKNDEFEVFVGRNSISIIKRRPHHSKWKFAENKLSKEDEKWIDASLGEDDETW